MNPEKKRKFLIFFEDINADPILKLMVEAERFMNYDTFAASSDFLQIPLQLLINILSSDQFNVKNEEEVVKFVKCWVEHIPGRERHIPELLDVIRLDQLPINTLLELEQWEPGKVEKIRQY